MVQSTSFSIHFDDASAEAGNKYAAELQRELTEITPDLKITSRKDDQTTQDFGATLVLLVGSAATVEIAKGIADWLRKRDQATITIKAGNTSAALSGLKSKDALKIVEFITSQAHGDSR